MPYVEAITKAGNTVEIERYYTSRYNKRGQSRSKRVKPTKEEQKKVNKRQAEKKLRRILNANFSGKDYHVVLPYIHKAGEPYRTREEMQEDIAIFLRKLRKAYRAEGKELKYVCVAEIGSKGARHFHLIVNHTDTQAITDAWTHARAQIFPLDRSGNYAKLAAYLIKYTDAHVGQRTEEALTGKRWSCSKNLIRPETEIKIITSRNWFKEVPTVPKRFKGYEIDKESVVVGINRPEYYGYGFMRYTLVMRC